ncbi:hypothetical protein F2Q69_00054424 [Brassica cretica]|uniref:Uncharacterized protein n=1 Tax=Brassica cretica TaxID=69181 RepID=A0A8S9MWJ6_BRACR|nr:hypothetical protein F2Q69_00054424 [Brassica cretica]
MPPTLRYSVLSGAIIEKNRGSSIDYLQDRRCLELKHEDSGIRVDLLRPASDISFSGIGDSNIRQVTTHSRSAGDAIGSLHGNNFGVLNAKSSLQQHNAHQSYKRYEQKVLNCF